jgi:hypothetical protein
MYIGGGILGTLLVVALIFFLLRGPDTEAESDPDVDGFTRR